MSGKPKFFTDTHVSAKAVEQLRLRGLDIVRCEAVGLAEAKDRELLEFAAKNQRCMVSCDADFRELHFEWVEQEKDHAGIIHMNPERHCKHIGELVRIMLYYYEVADSEEDLFNQIWEGNEAR